MAEVAGTAVLVLASDAGLAGTAGVDEDGAVEVGWEGVDVGVVGGIAAVVVVVVGVAIGDKGGLETVHFHAGNGILSPAGKHYTRHPV